MKKFILSTLFALLVLPFAMGANATVYESTLDFHGGLLYGEDKGLIAAAEWWLDPNLPPFEQEAWWDLNYEYKVVGKYFTEGGPQPYYFENEGSLFEDKEGSLADKFGTEANLDYLLMEVADFITGGPYVEEGLGFLYFDTDESLLHGTVIAGLAAEPANYLKYMLAEHSGNEDLLDITGAALFIKGSITLVADDHEVPEPATLALLGIGLLGFGARRRLTR